jgi:predicted RNase H-like nuclease
VAGRAGSERVVGADGCPAGWLAVTMPPGAPARAEACIVFGAGDLLPLGAPVAIDIPIGLMDRPESGPRPADRAARAFLQDRNADALRGVGTRVFAAPTRAHLDAFRRDPDYAAFRRAFRPPRSLSKQCWNICGKIAELDDGLRSRPEAPIREAHPEVAFAFHAGRTLPPKKSPLGARARRVLLAAQGFDLPALASALPRRGWAPDDLLDACILALTAQRIATGTHAGLPNLTDRDSQGLRRVIHY